jgi:uncharacterized membrane protein (UPF0136 family)
MALVGKISLLVLAVLVCGGGLAGFLKAKSKASLISGIISAALLACAYSVASRNLQQGLIFGTVISGLLCVIFGIRLAKTRKFMPAGMMLALCLIECVLLAVSMAG